MPPRGAPQRDAMHVVFLILEERGAEVRCGFSRKVRRQHAAQPECRQARVRVAQAVLGLGRAVPYRHHAEHGGEILADHLGAQLVEVEPVDERDGERARAVDEEAAAVLGRRLGHDHVDHDLALRGEQRGECRALRRHLVDVGGEQPVEEFARVLAGDLDHAAIGQQGSFHE